MLFDLNGKWVLISGWGGNLGPIWKKTMLNAGAFVHGFDLPEVDITELKDLLDYKQYWLKNDIVPDIIINNAAIDNPPDDGVNFWSNLESIINVNLLGAATVTNLFLDDMIHRGSGVIINIGSIQGNIAADYRNYDSGFEKPVGYNLTKAAYIQFTRSLAVQYGQHGIRSVCLSFGAVNTGKLKEPFKSKFLNCLPLKRFISLDSLQMSLLYAACCPELTGQQVLVDSGYTAW